MAAMATMPPSSATKTRTDERHGATVSSMRSIVAAAAVTALLFYLLARIDAQPDDREFRRQLAHRQINRWPPTQLQAWR